jgi:hypothetical protein
MSPLIRRCLVLASAAVLLLAGSAASRTRANSSPAQASPEAANATVDTLRFGYTTAELDALFRSLPAGPMPGKVTAGGYVRCRAPGCESRGGNALLNDPIVPLLWKGQVWDTDATGGTLTNRVLNDTRREYPATVGYGPAIFDGNPAIEVAYPPDRNPRIVDDLYLDCRDVENGVYLCYVFIEVPGTERHQLLFNVIENTTSPD